MRTLGVYLACYLLKLPLNVKQRTKLVCAMLDTNNAVPLAEIFKIEADGKLYVRGEEVDYDKAVKLRESADMALNSSALELVNEQVASIAGKRGIAEGDSPDKLIFYRAALWWGGLQQEYLELLAGRK